MLPSCAMVVLQPIDQTQGLLRRNPFGPVESQSAPARISSQGPKKGAHTRIMLNHVSHYNRNSNLMLSGGMRA